MASIFDVPASKEAATSANVPRKSNPQVINLQRHISHTSADTSYQGKFVKMVRQACLDFNMIPLKYKQNTFEQSEVLEKIEQKLLELQEFLGQEGCYD